MAYDPNELVTSFEQENAQLRVEAYTILPGTIAPIAGAPILPKLQPMAFSTATERWVRPVPSVTESNTLVGTGTISGGNYTITVNGETTGNIAHSANAAAIKTALVALGNVNDEDVTVTGGPMSTNTDAVITWTGNLADRPMAVSVTSSVTGGGTVTMQETTAGGLVELRIIRAFIWPDAIQTHATLDVLGQMVRRAKIHAGDIPTWPGVDQTQLNAMLRGSDLRAKGFDIQGLSGMY